MIRKTMLVVTLVILALTAVGAVSAAPGQPNFAPALYADGEVYGTKFTTVLPAANDNNMQSFDKLFVITNGAAGQMPVAEAAPGNPAYNGGRWATQTVVWTPAGFDHHGDVPVLTSYADIMLHESLGHLTVTAGSPGGPPDFFQCPLLPVK
jgi:hypothetical protein